MIRRFLEALGLKAFALELVRKFVRWQARVKPIRLCRRRGIRYRLDLSERIDAAIYLGGWERGTLRFLEDTLKLSDVVVEVGANVGAHTLEISRKVGGTGRVYAFEPTKFARTKLNANIALNAEFSGNIVVLDDLVSNARHDFPQTDIKSSWRFDKKTSGTERVMSQPITLDEFVERAALTKVSLLKIDVDGYDFKVLEGATALIAKFKPIIFIELCEHTLCALGDSVRDIFVMMERMGYGASYESGEPIPGADAVLAEITKESSLNGVFVPLN